jgi:hypothetical protein
MSCLSALVVLGVLLFGGALGGFARFLIRSVAGMRPDGASPLAPSLTVGLSEAAVGAVAALIVPVFLTVAQIGADAGVIEAITSSDPSEAIAAALNLLGLSVLVGTIAPRFLTTVAERVLLENSEELRKISAENQRQLDEMRAIKREIELVADQVVPGTAKPDAKNPNPVELRVMRAIADLEESGVRRPTFLDLAGRTQIEVPKVQEAVRSLAESRLVAKSGESTSTEDRWRLRDQGWSVLRDKA